MSLGQEKIIVKKHDNGKPHVIVYVKGNKRIKEKVKEEVYYENGNLDYSGEYKNGVEHGEWKYYYKHGTIMAEEQYKKGREDGVFKEYHPDGQLKKEIHYNNGQLIKVIEH